MTRLLHLSDPHFGACDPAIARAFLAKARDLNPHHTILSGDLTMRARLREYEESRKFISQLPEPLLVIPGNHDIPALNHVLDRFFNPFRRYRRFIAPELEPGFSDRNLQILSLNTSRAFGLHVDWSDGFLSRGQLARINVGFRDNVPFKILVMHHPLLARPGYQRALVKPLPDLLEAIANAKVDLVLCGHFHVSKIATAGILDGWKCVVSQAPTVCSTRLQGEPQGYHDICLSPEKITVTHQRFDGKTFSPFSTSDFQRTDSGWENCNSEQHDEVVSLG
jgi:3',5'-cyclic AMP phosphodiesterase CpdA